MYLYGVRGNASTSFSWKHWKNINKDTDWDNVTVEIVDIWHFIMSLLLEDYKTNGKGDIDKLVLDVILDVQGFEAFNKRTTLSKFSRPNGVSKRY